LQSRLKIFYSAIFLTTLLPYVPFILPLIPYQIFGLNLTGWAWMIMLLVTAFNLLRTGRIEFPLLLWLPWVLYIVIYLVIDFSFLGLQLTLQYTLPLFIGIVASGFSYDEEVLEWLFKRILGLCIFIFLLSVARVMTSGFGPSMSSTPMLFSIAVSILVALRVITKENRYIFLITILFIIPVVQVTRMGIAAMVAVIIFHFAHRSIQGKLVFGGTGILVMFLVFNSRSFQEKTFYAGSGTVRELTVNYYDNQNIRSNGRLSWKEALDPGLKAAPVWGNGPRADNAFLSRISRQRGGEAHNDYLSVRFNYGYVGLALLLFGFATTFVSLFRLSVRYSENDYIWIVSTSALTLFISFLMFMYTDNILKYTIYFPNYFFALIGIVYSLKRDEDLRGNTPLQ
jgi:O-Antigen ligase